MSREEQIVSGRIIPATIYFAFDLEPGESMAIRRTLAPLRFRALELFVVRGEKLEKTFDAFGVFMVSLLIGEREQLPRKRAATGIAASRFGPGDLLFDTCNIGEEIWLFLRNNTKTPQRGKMGLAGDYLNEVAP